MQRPRAILESEHRESCGIGELRIKGSREVKDTTRKPTEEINHRGSLKLKAQSKSTQGGTHGSSPIYTRG